MSRLTPNLSAVSSFVLSIWQLAFHSQKGDPVRWCRSIVVESTLPPGLRVAVSPSLAGPRLGY